MHVIAVATEGGVVFRNDGAVFIYDVDDEGNSGWQEIEPVPGTDRAEELRYINDE